MTRLWIEQRSLGPLANTLPNWPMGILDHNALDQEEKILCATAYLKTKSLKTVQAEFSSKFNFNNYPQKSQIYRWVHKFQAT